MANFIWPAIDSVTFTRAVIYRDSTPKRRASGKRARRAQFAHFKRVNRPIAFFSLDDESKAVL
jgi:hypothetical protein